MPTKRITAQEAYDMANIAQSTIARHEAVCTERWTQARILMEKANVKLDELTSRSDQVKGGIFMGRAIWAALCGLAGAVFSWLVSLHK